MLRKDTNLIKDVETQGLFEHILQEGMGNPVTLESAPTTAGAELATNEWGFYGDDLYVNLNGTVRKFSGTAV